MTSSSPPTVVLAVTGGPLVGVSYQYDERTTALVGRGRDCVLRLPDDPAHRTISRHHAFFDINPPDIRVRDFGSLNGTYLNGDRIGGRSPDQTPEQAADQAFPEHDLVDGDEIRLGDTVLTVIARSGHSAANLSVRCEQCGREAEDTRDGEYLCAECRAHPASLVKALLETSPLAGYSLVRELGSSVFLTNDAAGTPAALKVMLPAVAATAEASARFLRDVAVPRTLEHPGIARLRFSGTASGVFYFTSEYCAGGSMAQYVAAQGPLPVGEAVRLAVDALEALEYAHDRGVVHRDLTPHNILLTADPSPQVKLSDFALAKSFDQAGLSGLTRTGSAATLPTYLPYQQVVNFRAGGPELDVWALAACIYFMLTGAGPREFPPGRDPWHVVLMTQTIPIRQRRPDLPAALATVLDTALRDQPEIGFPSASALREALTIACGIGAR